jgi:hypothetical protein
VLINKCKTEVNSLWITSSRQSESLSLTKDRSYCNSLVAGRSYLLHSLTSYLLHSLTPSGAVVAHGGGGHPEGAVSGVAVGVLGPTAHPGLPLKVF